MVKDGELMIFKGNPVLAISTNLIAVKGVSRDGLMTTVQPAAKAGPSILSVLPLENSKG